MMGGKRPILFRCFAGSVETIRTRAFTSIFLRFGLRWPEYIGAKKCEGLWFGHHQMHLYCTFHNQLLFGR